ncbi:hypothetical protein [Anatilimnocola floriformis]|uniref:hypothetical protein n=1 Tax=Anatilimnocola floriformis TaxID=2948575 RepID=UPI0020C450C6|nr:hypothetical protein [Anatilimnocola floriformis]
MQSEPELTQYRAISFWAVATLIVGLAAPLALVGPLLWWVPLATIPLGIVAFRQLRQLDPRYVGQTAAVIGVCSAALFFAWAVSQRMSRELQITAEAKQLADDYLKLILAGKIPAAHQIQTAAARRQTDEANLDAFYEAQAEAGRDLQTFRSLEPVKYLAGQQGKIELQMAEVLNHTIDGTSDYVTLRYEATSGQIPTPSGSVWITAKRDSHPDAPGSDWQISSISVSSPAP